MTYRNRSLLDLAHEAPCMLQIEGVCVNGRFPSVPAHSNRQRHGRGVGHKSADCFAVAACWACHGWLDTGSAPRSDKQEAFDAGLERYWLWLWENDKIGVK
jgi:hypothetical protein